MAQAKKSTTPIAIGSKRQLAKLSGFCRLCVKVKAQKDKDMCRSCEQRREAFLRRR